MIPFDIPPGTTLETLLHDVAPSFHAQSVPRDVPVDPLTIHVRVEGAGDWTVRIDGSAMRVVDGEPDRPTLWVHTTAHAVARFLEDATGARRWVPRGPPPPGAVAFSDPRLVKRAAMASGRIELAIPDVDGERLAVVLGFGAAARRPIDPDRPDAVVEATIDTLQRMLAGALPPEDALSDGGVRVRGNRFLPMQLALAAAPFYPRSPVPPPPVPPPPARGPHRQR
jgi:hypothetical protein